MLLPGTRPVAAAPIAASPLASPRPLPLEPAPMAASPGVPHVTPRLSVCAARPADQRPSPIPPVLA
eukprot:4092328-Prymnesium_polylepis.1